MSLQKKLDKEYMQGFNDACDLWENVSEQTKGIGPELQRRMMDTVRTLATQKRTGKREG
jgi:hypothetical protein